MHARKMHCKLNEAMCTQKNKCHDEEICFSNIVFSFISLSITCCQTWYYYPCLLKSRKVWSFVIKATSNFFCVCLFSSCWVFFFSFGESTFICVCIVLSLLLHLMLFFFQKLIYDCVFK